VNIHHAYVAGCGDDQKAFVPKRTAKGSFDDRRKEQRLMAYLIDEVWLFNIYAMGKHYRYILMKTE